MNKENFHLLLIATVIFCCQNVYAHNDNIQKKETERKVEAEQEASDDWDNFMSKIKSQEKNPDDKAEKGQAELPDQ